jgi:hypothetical protein
MPQKVTDITARTEKPQNQENIVKPEAMPQPAGFEVAPEKPLEQIPQIPGEGKIAEERREIGGIVQPAPMAPQAPAKSLVLEKIEDILEEDLEQIYFQMPPQKQAEFNKVGEETATKINQLLQGVRVQVRKILDLIVRWLKIIPGINKYFLEQEAKIKTDELLKLRTDRNQRQHQGGASDQNKI